MIPSASVDSSATGGVEIEVDLDLEEIERAIQGWCGRLDAALVTGAEAAKGVERLATAIRLLEAAEAALAGRVDHCHAQPATCRTTAEWLARQNGSSRAEAQRTLDTAARLPECPTTAAALASGELSLDQAAVVTGAAAVDPSAERRLVEQARTHDLYETRAAADRVKQSARSFEEAAAREARLRRGRHWRTERGAEGHTEVRAAFVPADFARAKPVIDAFLKQRIDQARRAGEREPFERYAADAVVAAICAAGQIPSDPTSGPSVAPDQLALPTDAPLTPDPPTVDWSVVVLIDGIALRRGWAAPGETCEVPGIGPVSVPWVRSLLPEAQVEMLIHDSVDIRAYATSTRHRPRPVELAVRVRDRDATGPAATTMSPSSTTPVTSPTRTTRAPTASAACATTITTPRPTGVATSSGTIPTGTGGLRGRTRGSTNPRPGRSGATSPPGTSSTHPRPAPTRPPPLPGESRD